MVSNIVLRSFSGLGFFIFGYIDFLCSSSFFILSEFTLNSLYNKSRSLLQSAQINFLSVFLLDSLLHLLQIKLNDSFFQEFLLKVSD